MKWVIWTLLVIFGFGCKPSIYLQRASVQLTNPIIDTKEVFFEGSATVTISPTANNAQNYYSISGSEMLAYKEPIVISESATIDALASGGGYIPSDLVSSEVLKLPKIEIISIDSDRRLDEKYGNGGMDILIDRNKGDLDFNKGWLGYGGDTIVFDLSFDVFEIDYLILSTLRNQSAWIFSPAQVNVYSNGKSVGQLLLNDAINKAKKSNVFTKIDLPQINTKQLKIEIIAPKEIPAWHPGSGHKPWIFIDEILIY